MRLAFAIASNRAAGPGLTRTLYVIDLDWPSGSGFLPRALLDV